jgi:putative transposase
MILTYVLRHREDFSTELVKAKQIAEYGIQHRTISSKDVKHFGLKSIISNQILRKYSRNKRCKSVKRVNLVIPSQGIKVNKTDRVIRIPCLKLEFSYQFPNDFQKINQIEISENKIFVSVSVKELDGYEPKSFIGVDRNVTGHCVVLANEGSGKVLKLGKKSKHIHKKYSNIRKRLQKQSKLKQLKKIKTRESRIVKDLNHKISRKIVSFAKTSNAGIVLEDLKGIRKSKKHRKSFNYALHSWSFYQLEKMIEYKAKLLGVPISKIDPRYTSQQCSKCGLLGKRKGKHFECFHCGNVEDADVNAAFVIALRHKGILQSPVDRDAVEGSTDTPEEATSKKAG